MKKVQTAVILISLAACATGCGRDESQSQYVDADPCIIIDLRKYADSVLAPDLEAFAQSNKLEVDRTLPIPAVYTLNRDGKKVALISYAVEKREIGSELALFRFDEAGSAELAAALREFVDKKIKPRYATYQCSEVPDYELPKVSR